MCILRKGWSLRLRLCLTNHQVYIRTFSLRLQRRDGDKEPFRGERIEHISVTCSDRNKPWLAVKLKKVKPAEYCFTQTGSRKKSRENKGWRWFAVRQQAALPPNWAKQKEEEKWMRGLKTLQKPLKLLHIFHFRFLFQDLALWCSLLLFCWIYCSLDTFSWRYDNFSFLPCFWLLVGLLLLVANISAIILIQYNTYTVIILNILRLAYFSFS